MKKVLAVLLLIVFAAMLCAGCGENKNNSGNNGLINGGGKNQCSYCGGKGKIVCDICGGDGWITDGYQCNCDNGYEECPICGGSGSFS